MAIEIAVTTVDPNQSNNICLDDTNIVPTLGEEEAIAIKLEEIVKSISDSVSKSIKVDSDLTVEISGGITLTAKGQLKWLFVNIGGDAKATNSLRIVLRTKIVPI